MSLLAPALLAGLGLLLVPVLVHLTRRQRDEVTPFPSLMFLRRIPFRTTKRRRIRHPLLFALRCLALVLLVLAFARPFTTGGAAEADERNRDVVLLLDTSGSLGYGGRRAAALGAAGAALGELAEGDRAAIVAFDDRAAEHVALTSDLASVRAALEALPWSDRPTRLEAGLQLAGRILGDSDRAEREVVLISDFQRTGWEDGGRTRLPDGVRLRTVDVGEGAAPNLTVSDVRLAAGDSDRHRIVARITNLGDEARAGLEVSLELSGRTVAGRPLDLEPRSAGTVVFDDVPVPAGAPRGRILLAGASGDGSMPVDRLPADDELRFLASAEAALDVRLFEAPRGRADRSLFLERALGLGEEPRMRVVRAGGGPDGGALAAASAIVLNDAPPDAARAERLRAWVAAGGALLVALGPESTPARWSGSDLGLLGGAVGEVADRAARAGSRLAWLDYDHPVFELFASPGTGDFSSARFWRFRDFEPGPDVRVLARLDGGEPALLEHALGEGRVLVWTSTLDRYWNDLALQPVFLPFVHRALRHAAGWRPAERWIRAGDALELAALVGEEAAGAGDWVLVSPDEERRPIEPAVAGDSARRWIEFDEVGFYRVEPLEPPAGATDATGATGVTVAVNLPPSESDLSVVPPERVAGDVVGAPAEPGGPAPAAGEARGAGGAASATAAAAPGRRELWWPLLLAAAVVLGVEGWLANRYVTGRGA